MSRNIFFFVTCLLHVFETFRLRLRRNLWKTLLFQPCVACCRSKLRILCDCEVFWPPHSKARSCVWAGWIIIRLCGAWRDVDLSFYFFFFSLLGTRERELWPVNAKLETGAESASRSHVSTGGTLVLTIRPRGPVFVFAAPWYCSAAKFNLGGICKQCGEACGASVSVCMDEPVCLYVRAVGCLCASDSTPQWSMALCTEFLISVGIHTFQTLLRIYLFIQ